MMSVVAPANQHQYQEEHNPSKRQHLVIENTCHMYVCYEGGWLV